MHIMTRVGTAVLAALGDSGDFVRGLHSVGAPLATRRTGCALALQRGAQVHLPFPRDPRDLVLRLGLRRQRAARQEMPRPAHRLGAWPATRAGWPSTCSSWLTSPEGEDSTSPRAFPSACGKTNLAMLDAHPAGLEGRDHRRRHRLDEVGADGRLHAINPEVGLLRRGAWHIGSSSNPNAMRTLATQLDLHERAP